MGDDDDFARTTEPGPTVSGRAIRFVSWTVPSPGMVGLERLALDVQVVGREPLLDPGCRVLRGLRARCAIRVVLGEVDGELARGLGLERGR